MNKQTNARMNDLKQCWPLGCDQGPWGATKMDFSGHFPFFVMLRFVRINFYVWPSA